MKAIILAGGYGTRISEETDTKPKPMVLLDDKPVIWHLMNSFSTQGVNEFIIAAGYLGNVIIDYIANLKTEWDIKVLDTGLNTLTGGRIKQCIESDYSDRFFVTYGDGLGNVNLNQLLKHHESIGKIATVTCVRPPARFGVLEKSNGLVTHFGEKRQSDVGWINGGYFVLERSIAHAIPGNDSSFEMDVMPKLASEGSLAAFEHEGFWQPMDTLRERNLLADLAIMSTPPWLLSKK
jgi:glucose-1-phosphate cytidylyltransferase